MTSIVERLGLSAQCAGVCFDAESLRMMEALWRHFDGHRAIYQLICALHYNQLRLDPWERVAIMCDEAPKLVWFVYRMVFEKNIPMALLMAMRAYDLSHLFRNISVMVIFGPHIESTVKFCIEMYGTESVMVQNLLLGMQELRKQANFDSDLTLHQNGVFDHALEIITSQ